MYFTTHFEVAEGISFALGQIAAALVLLSSALSIVFAIFSIACAVWDCLILIVQSIIRLSTADRRIVSIEARKH